MLKALFSSSFETPTIEHSTGLVSRMQRERFFCFPFIPEEENCSMSMLFPLQLW